MMPFSAATVSFTFILGFQQVLCPDSNSIFQVVSPHKLPRHLHRQFHVHDKASDFEGHLTKSGQ